MVKKIFLDKGHGGTDPGAAANGLLEKDITYLIVEHAEWYLKEFYTGFEIKESRPGNETVSLQQRTDMANEWGAHVFWSSHINAGGGDGFESFIYNGAVGASTVELQNILHAEVIVAMRKFGTITDRGKKRANFHVLRETNMPAILTESLFIDNAANAVLLKDKDGFLREVGHAHARGLAKYLRLPEKQKPNTGQKVNVITGWYYEGSEGLAELEKFLKSKGWYYRKEKA